MIRHIFFMSSALLLGSTTFIAACNDSPDVPFNTNTGSQGGSMGEAVGSGGEISTGQGGNGGQGGEAPALCGGSVCQDGTTCCNDECVDLNSDVLACGSCVTPCEQPPNLQVSCNEGMCVYGPCDDGFNNCDGKPATTGCMEGPCSCTPGEVQTCHPGAPDVAGVGACNMGFQVCNAAGTAWSLCENFTMPTEQDICNNGVDDDCDGVMDNDADADGDGWRRCRDNDCCDSTLDGCTEPALVNPGAFDDPADDVDDDCRPVNAAEVDCSVNADFTVTSEQMVKAMDICHFTDENEPLVTRQWGVVEHKFVNANGSNLSAAHLNAIQANQAAVLADFGTVITPRKGSTMAGMATGMMRDGNDPGYASGGQGTAFGREGSPPPFYLSANGGNLPGGQLVDNGVDGCNARTCEAGDGANDAVNLRVRIRVPSNAKSFSYQFKFYSAEFKSFTCTQYNDFYITQLITGAFLGENAMDRNISFDAQNSPVSVNNGFFQVCKKDLMTKPCYLCPEGDAELAGTGPVLKAQGGATLWLRNAAPVIPNEIMQLDMMIFDVSDQKYDSLVLLDDFRWSVETSAVVTAPG